MMMCQMESVKVLCCTGIVITFSIRMQEISAMHEDDAANTLTLAVDAGSRRYLTMLECLGADASERIVDPGTGIWREG
jgi:hypothetical protein